jgi:hypothetical protein
MTPLPTVVATPHHARRSLVVSAWLWPPHRSNVVVMYIWSWYIQASTRAIKALSQNKSSLTTMQQPNASLSQLCVCTAAVYGNPVPLALSHVLASDVAYRSPTCPACPPSSPPPVCVVQHCGCTSLGVGWGAAAHSAATEERVPFCMASFSSPQHYGQRACHACYAPQVALHSPHG